MVGTRQRSSRVAVPSPSSEMTCYSDIGVDGGGGGATGGRGGLTIPVLLNEAQKSSLGPGQVRWPRLAMFVFVFMLSRSVCVADVGWSRSGIAHWRRLPRLITSGSVRVGALGPVGK